jgi:hypothetical protein
MKFLLPIICWLFPAFALPQANDSLAANIPADKMQAPGPEILSGGFIDIVQNGQVNASARLFRLYIGEPGKFQLPISVYTGVSANNFSNSLAADDILLTLINPGTGIFNMCFDGNAKLMGGRKKLTTFLLQYQAGLRFLSAYNKITVTNTTFFNLVTGTGLTFITGAWEKNKSSNLGAFWLNLRGLYSSSPRAILKDFFTVPVTTDMFGYSVGMGIEISQALNVKIFYFRFLNNRQIAAFTQPFLELSFTYSVR